MRSGSAVVFSKWSATGMRADGACGPGGISRRIRSPETAPLQVGSPAGLRVSSGSTGSAGMSGRGAFSEALQAATRRRASAGRIVGHSGSAVAAALLFFLLLATLLFFLLLAALVFFLLLAALVFFLLLAALRLFLLPARVLLLL